MAYYHFVREHESLRVKLETPQTRKGKQRVRKYKKRTPCDGGRVDPTALVSDGADQFSAALKQEKRGDGEERIETIGPIPPGFWAWLPMYVKIAPKWVRFNYLQPIVAVPLFCS
jgi:hypothetical protein